VRGEKRARVGVLRKDMYAGVCRVRLKEQEGDLPLEG